MNYEKQIQAIKDARTFAKEHGVDDYPSDAAIDLLLAEIDRLREQLRHYQTAAANKAKVIYICGPYRAPNEYEVRMNIRRAEAAALDVWRAGGVALCPHKNSAGFGGACPDEVWLQGDLELVRRCDALYVTEGWQTSAGANGEINLAIELGLPAFYSNNRVSRERMEKFCRGEGTEE